MKNSLHRFLHYQELLKETNPTDFRVYLVGDENIKNQAKRLHANIYIQNGYNTKKDLNQLGHLNKTIDPHQEHSQYFVVTKMIKGKEEVQATARQILAHKEKGHNSFQTYGDLPLFPYIRTAIDNLRPDQCVEISALAKKSDVQTYATFLLYRIMWQCSLMSDHQIWLMSCDTKLLDRMKYLFGDALVVGGRKKFYKGHEVVPVLLEVDKSLDVLVKESKTLNPIKRTLKKQVIRFFLRGLPNELIEKKNLKDVTPFTLKGKV